MSDKEQTQQLIALANNCFLCPEADFTTPQNLRKHLMNVHQLQLPGRPMGVKHRDTADIVYIARKTIHPNVNVNNACPSCCFHSIDIEDLKQHVETNHNIVQRNQPEELEPSHRRKKSRTEYAAFSTNKNIITFTAMDENFYNPHQPKLTVETISKLKSLVTISTSYNRDMTDFWKTKLEEHVSTQSSLGTLKSFPAIFDLVTAAMEKPMHSLPAFLWNYDLQTNMEEEQLGKIVQFVLTDFVGKCNRP
ncbi:hypothetical protein G6F70_009340 [Rhizopus microsporus]|nr:hypothetical protein G6F71_009336 [Rhizopus microsporus]KAG1191142.1 hypothetical protein G6F70_009340 [Rhizopus microsporus]KAG1225207.1 hypothetical protein G6F67_009359 [Rhizopus microsporus]KAG1254313.1 hypothetical protein G6F68_010909 [Rhizopus microsporus]